MFFLHYFMVFRPFGGESSFERLFFFFFRLFPSNWHFCSEQKPRCVESAVFFPPKVIRYYAARWRLLRGGRMKDNVAQVGYQMGW